MTEVCEQIEPLINITNSCWLWLGHISPEGYGRLYRHDYAHRVVWETLVSPIPDGLVVDHLCEVRHCVNPDHLQIVTRWENVLRDGKSPLVKKARQTRCIHGHELTEDNTYYRPDGTGRQCKKCNYNRNKKARLN